MSNTTTLQPHQIASYLPYKVFGQWVFQKRVQPGAWYLANLSVSGSIQVIKSTKTRVKSECQRPLNEFTPYLVPLQKLSTLDWQLVFSEGLKNASPTLPSHFLAKSTFIELHGNSGVECVINRSEGLLYEFDNGAFECNGIRFNQIAAREALFLLHADVNGLIASGLAYDKTLLPKQL